MAVFQLYGEGGRWIGEAEDVFSARRACETLIEDGEAEARFEDDKGLRLESATMNDHGVIVWQTSDLVRQYDGRAR